MQNLRSSRQALALALFVFLLLQLSAKSEELFDASSFDSITDSHIRFMRDGNLSDGERTIFASRLANIEIHYEIHEDGISDCFRRTMHGRTPKEVISLGEFCGMQNKKTLWAQLGKEFQLTVEAPAWYVAPNECKPEDERRSTQVLSEKEINETIVGYWAESSDTYSINNFGIDGTYTAKTWKTDAKDELLYITEGIWWVENTTLNLSLQEAATEEERSFYLVTYISDSKIEIRAPFGTLELEKVNGFHKTPN